jgi:hypothetical protein
MEKGDLLIPLSSWPWPLFIGPRIRGGCEWDPIHDKPSYAADQHTASALATWYVGQGCVDLPQFRRMRRRRLRLDDYVVEIEM